MLDPALPVGLVGPKLGLPYAVVLHGAEVTVAARLPVTSQLLRRVLVGADLVIAAGGYPADEARRLAGEDLPEVAIAPRVSTCAASIRSWPRRSAQSGGVSGCRKPVVSSCR